MQLFMLLHTMVNLLGHDANMILRVEGEKTSLHHAKRQLAKWRWRVVASTKWKGQKLLVKREKKTGKCEWIADICFYLSVTIWLKESLESSTCEIQNNPRPQANTTNRIMHTPHLQNGNWITSAFDFNPVNLRTGLRMHLIPSLTPDSDMTVPSCKWMLRSGWKKLPPSPPKNTHTPRFPIQINCV